MPRTLKDTPETLSLWSVDLNGCAGDDIPSMSNKKAWWRCSLNHVWQAKIANVSLGSRCPACATGTAIVAQGVNDLASRFPEIAKEWHPTNNGVLRPDQVRYGSKVKRWWLGTNCRHSWQATPNMRTSDGGRGCAVCRGFQVVIGINDAASHSPNLVAEWSRKNMRTLAEYSYGSSYRAAWECSKGHEWYASISSRTLSKSGCARCVDRANPEVETIIANTFIASGVEDAIIHHRVSDVRHDTGLPIVVDIFIPKLNMMEIIGIWIKKSQIREKH